MAKTTDPSKLSDAQLEETIHDLNRQMEESVEGFVRALRPFLDERERRIVEHSAARKIATSSPEELAVFRRLLGTKSIGVAGIESEESVTGPGTPKPR